MEGAVFPVLAFLVCDAAAETWVPEAVEKLEASGFRVSVRNTRGYQDSDFDSPTLLNGRHVIVGMKQVLDFAKSCKPNFFG